MAPLEDLLGDVVEGGERARIVGALREKIAVARSAWPELAVDDDAFVRHVTRHLAGGDVLAQIERVVAADVLLVVACLRGDPAALRAFDAGLLKPSAEEAARSHRGVEAAELAQIVREKVLVARAGAEPKLASYGGRAPLGAWLRVVCVHAAVSAMRKVKPASSFEEVSEVLSTVVTTDVELARLEHGHRADFKAAFHDALAELEADDKTLLRLHVIEQLGIDDLAKAFGIHRATAARRLVRIREGLFVSTRSHLRRRLAMDDEEFESLVGALLSQLDVSLDRALGATG
ncbi:MAG: sigma-70 family RNA polymerase sigma factor [Deltaproteobacteria bacterium]|nr:sigma-70 family RNA polymerase sigma factor [Deltaproteobacteria bacterium]